MEEINSIIFDDVEVEDDFRWLLKQRFAEDDLYDLFGTEINFVSMDTDLSNKTKLPAVTLSVVQLNYLNKTDIQIQENTQFYVEVNVYTSGDEKVRKNKTLCNEIIKILQSNGQLPNYYCRGLQFGENREVSTLVDSAYRRVIRMNGLCNNKQKLIK